MTLQDLIQTLENTPPATPLIFVAPQGPVRGGYHLTEVKRADVTGLACNGSQDSWREVSIQLLDGFGGPHMPVGKAAKIIHLALNSLPDVADAPLHMEYGPRNASRELYTLEPPVFDNNTMTIALKPTHVGCKALTAEQEAQVIAASRCC